MHGLEQKHGIWVNDQPIDGEADDSEQWKQESQRIQRKNRSRQIPKTVLLLLSLFVGDATGARRSLLEIQALLQLLNKSNERKRANDDGDEIEEGVRDDEVNDEGVWLAHVLQMIVALKAEQCRRDGKGRELQLIELLGFTNQKSIVDHLQHRCGDVLDAQVRKWVERDRLFRYAIFWLKG